MNGALQTGKWYHVAGTWDGTTQRLYLNGEEVGSATPGGTLDSGTGAVFVSHCVETMDGYIDEARIWGHARTADEIRSSLYRELAGTETGVEHYWKFNESSGDYAYDSAGSVDLVLYGDPDWVTSGAFCGPRNTLSFDGSDDYVAIPASTSPDNGMFTVEYWPKMTSSGNWDGMLDKGRNTNSDWYFLTRTSAEGQGVIFGIGTGSSRAELSYSWSDIQWHHVAGTYDGTTMRLFVDGVARGSRTTSMSVTTNAIVFGNRLSGSGWCYQGLVDEVRIWDDVRTPAEIRDHMCRSMVGDEEGLVGYWRCDQVVGTTLYDWSANDNHGTLVNMADDDWIGSMAFNTWIGCVGTDWAEDANWSLGHAPDLTIMNVGIPLYSGGNEPQISEGYTCGHLVITSGATLTIDGGGRSRREWERVR